MKYVYEFIGTFFLVLTIGMTVIHPNNTVAAPLAIGAILTAFVFAGGHVSGAHYNPAVSLAAFLRKLLTFPQLIFYWIAQLIAGVAAAYLTILLKGHPSDSPIDLHIGYALAVEFLFAFALCFVVLNAAVARETSGNSYYGLAIGFTVLAGAYAVGAISGGAFNPAVALGICIMKLIEWSNLWIFIVANLIGGACAAWLFNASHPYNKTV